MNNASCIINRSVCLNSTGFVRECKCFARDHFFIYSIFFNRGSVHKSLSRSRQVELGGGGGNDGRNNKMPACVSELFV